MSGNATYQELAGEFVAVISPVIQHTEALAPRIVETLNTEQAANVGVPAVWTTLAFSF